jgi:NAD(P)-dependent dehydrogenase (short-subunit alcohol dehydrogenase family)
MHPHSEAPWSRSATSMQQAPACRRGVGGNATGFALDVTDRPSFDSFLSQVEQRLGPLDVMVNNAGIQHVGLFADESDACTDIQVDVNLGGGLTGSKLALARATHDARITPNALPLFSESGEQ